jgi:N-acetylmuramoyl-L-alanine amidase
VVALDPGHGGTNLGAHGPRPRLYEKDVTLLLARRARELASALGPQAPRLEIILCRDRDVLVPIRARARCAADVGADLFVSLHTNAVPAWKEKGGAHGFDLFVLDTATVREEAAVAASDAPEPTDQLGRVRAAHRVYASSRLARDAAAVLRAHLDAALGSEADRGLREGGALLDVLRGASAPAVLVEVGFLDHPEEGLRLGTEEGREPLAHALVAAFQDLARRRTKASAQRHERAPFYAAARRSLTPQ